MKLKRIFCLLIILAMMTALFSCSRQQELTEDEPEPYTRRRLKASPLPIRTAERLPPPKQTEILYR